ncbi:MAG TPA: NAD(P)/FAD-dependent oxidoreductase [Solirubrobacteraceae bacterium]|nr:NAD(P)/FAD-dependent oxidoreductase [Solirubrobacteraceae bacterium]
MTEVTPPPARADSARPRVVVLGGGFGGVFAARHLRHAAADVVLLDRGPSHLFQPLLYQVATGLLSEGQISTPLRSMFRRQRNVEVLLGEATDLDAERKIVVASRPHGSTFEIPYDYLVVAVGMRQSYFGHDEFSKVAPGMKTLGDALAIRRRVFGAFEMAESVPKEERGPWLTFAVTGAGPTGVELAGQIRELATRTLAREFRTIDPNEARVMLFDGVDSPLAPFGPRLSGKAASRLTKLGVELHMGVFVTDIDHDGLQTKGKDGTVERHAAKTVLWTAGVQAVPFVETLATALGVEQDRGGRVTVNPDLTVPGHPEVWVVGDIMALDGMPGVAEVALQGGVHAAAQIRRQIKGRPKGQERFKYRDVGSAAYICRFHALVQIRHIQLSGFLGWLTWGVIHLGFLSGLRNRVGVGQSWFLALLRGRRRERGLLYGDPRGLQDSFAD